MTAGLPESVASRIEMYPIEDFALALFRDAFPDVPIRSRIPGEPRLWPENKGALIVVRRAATWGVWAGDDRFIDHAGLAVHVFCYGDDADERAALISEACRVAVRQARREQKVFPGLGSLSSFWMEEEPLRKADWATATGPVQYADLPTGWERHETRYQLKIRRPIK